MPDPPQREGEMTRVEPDEAHAAILTGRVVRAVVGDEPDDPICLHYLDRCYEDDYEPMIYTESIAGWSEGAKEAICGSQDSFYVSFAASMTLIPTDQVPPRMERTRA
jgi:hypothetical protein